MRRLRSAIRPALTSSAALIAVMIAYSSAIPADAIDLPASTRQVLTQPIFAAVHPLTFAGFQLLASLAALVAFDN